ncbi:MAG: hypothetical protein JKY37_28940 [Nannocystaceae bacterium]|nr:hypothetical protein [Nannocystaceae bacterium]
MQQRAKWTLVLGVIAGLGCSVDGGEHGDFGEGGEGDAAEGKQDDPGEDDVSGDSGTDDGGDDDSAADDGGNGDDGSAQAYVEEAMDEFPTYMALHEKVITRTCTPFDNVCHNNKEYPELDTPLSVLSYFEKECNLPERTADPETIFNGCEPSPDYVVFTSGNNVGWAGTEVAWIETIYGPSGPTSFEVHLREPIPQGMLAAGVPETVRFTRTPEYGAPLTIDDIPNVVYGAGATYFTVTNAAGLEQTHLDSLETRTLGGDLNRDGVFGASDPDVSMRELNPGNPWQSYLLQRVQGNVPGSPMPLANQPLSAAEIVAVACWIEGADTPEGRAVDAVIDYVNCDYAAEFGTPPDDSGATLSGDVQPIFDAACAFSGCHGGGNPAAGLDLSPGNTRDSLLEQPSTQLPMIDLVELGNPTNSYLVKKIRGADDTVNAPMPPEGYEPLTEGQIGTIKLWISYGAPND